MSEPIVIKLPVKTVSEANIREHWALKARRARNQRQTALLFTQLAVRKFKPSWFPVKGKLVITITRIGVRQLDDDNLARAHKAVRDGIADALKVDDGDDRLSWCYEQRRGDVREYHVLVKLEA